MKKRNNQTSIPVRCAFDAMVRVDALKPHPGNPNRHPDEQIRLLAKIIETQGWRGAIVVSERSGYVVAGHGRMMAAQRLGVAEVPVDYQAFATEAEEMAHLIADNRIAELAEMDRAALRELAEALDTGAFDMEATGFDAAALEELMTAAPPEDAENAVPFTRESIIESALADFRKRGYPYRDLPVYTCKRQINALAQQSKSSLLTSRTAYQVADTFHPHRFHCSAERMKSPFEAFSDDADLSKAVALAIEQDKDVETVLWIVNGTQACANFRPGFALWVFRNFAPTNAVVLDSSTGFGGRLVGFIASDLKKYVGIDPSTKTHAANLAMCAALDASERVKLINKPAEDVHHSEIGACDFAFTSPPYFAKEHYSDEETQSWKRYATADAWHDGFLIPLLALQFQCLNPGCLSIINIADISLRGKRWPLVQWTIEAAKLAGFQHSDTLSFELQSRVGLEEEETAKEPLLIFTKPDGR